jgi:hypothetical protein
MFIERGANMYRDWLCTMADVECDEPPLAMAEPRRIMNVLLCEV